MKDARTAPRRLDPAAPPIPLLAELAPIGSDALEAATLPPDHPAWQRDVVSISARVRAVLAQLRPFALRVLTFWDHLVREAVIDGRRLEIDPSGSYRLRLGR